MYFENRKIKPSKSSNISTVKINKDNKLSDIWKVSYPIYVKIMIIPRPN